jgi:hypothetical protein
MYTQQDLDNALANAIYPVCLEEIEFRVAWSYTSNQPVFLFDQIDMYYTERGFSCGARYIERDLDVGCIPDGRQWMFKNLMDRFNRQFDLNLSY